MKIVITFCWSDRELKYGNINRDKLGIWELVAELIVQLAARWILNARTNRLSDDGKLYMLSIYDMNYTFWAGVAGPIKWMLV